MDVLGAVYDYLTSQLSLAPQNIVRGWQNRASLPNVPVYAVLTLVDGQRIGSNVLSGDSLTPSVGIDTTTSMFTRFAVQVDFCGLDEQSVMELAAQFCMMGRSASAVRFFESYDLKPLYTDNVRSLPFTDEQNQWCVRYSVTWHLGGWTRLTVNEDAFTAVTIQTENVDVHHPIN